MTQLIRSCTRTHREGQVLVFVVVVMVAMLGMMALAIDVGMGYTARAEAQRVADAAALAGASIFMEPNPDSASAAARAREWAAKNTVRNRPVHPHADVDVHVLMADSRVRVWISRSGLPTWFARFLGRTEITVRAMAAASVRDSGVAECLKPWAVIDLFHDADEVRPPAGTAYNPAAGHRYYPNINAPQQIPTGYGANAGDPGMRMTIKSPAPNSPYVPEPGVFLPIQIPQDPDRAICSPGGGGGAVYRNDICACNSSPIAIGDWLPIEPGNMVGPTRQGMDKLLAQETRRLAWSDTQKAVVDLDICSTDTNNVTTCRVVTASPLIAPMILIGPDQIVASGMQDVQVRNMALFFIEGFATPGNIAELTGRFLGPVQGLDESNTVTSPEIKILRLVE
jgi:hypothetical protein